MKHTRSSSQQILYSIIIPTLNEEKYIEKVLKSVLASTIPKKKYEIIVSDSGSTDGTEKIVSKVRQRLSQNQLLFVRAPKKGVSMARNTGAKYARGIYVIFLDADVHIAPDFLEKNLQEMQLKQLQVAGCFALPDSDKWIDKCLLGTMNVLGIKLLEHTSTPMAVGAAIFAKRDLHQKIKGFDTRLHMGEDLEYVTRAKQYGSFGVLESRPVIFSMRRFKEEGRLEVITKTLKGFFQHISHKDIQELNIKYEFGKHR